MKKSELYGGRTMLLLGVGFFVLAGYAAWRGLGADKWGEEADEVEVPSVRKLSRSDDPADRALAGKLGAEYDAKMAELIARVPSFEPKWRSLPDEENGFLQLYLLAERYAVVVGNEGVESLVFPKEFDQIRWGEKPWDSKIVGDLLREEENLLDEITRVGLLPERSTAGISPDHWILFGANFEKRCVDLLLMDARLAAESGDSLRAFQRVRAAMGLAAHLDQNEIPTLLNATVAILLRHSVHAQSMEYLIPSLVLQPKELSVWREVLRSPTLDTGNFADFLEGEGWAGTRALLIPMLSIEGAEFGKAKIADQDELLDAMAKGYLTVAGQVRIAPVMDLTSSKIDSWWPSTPGHLSRGSRDAYESWTEEGTLSSWGKGWARSVSVQVRVDAAMAILVGDTPPVEPVTGLPFDYDPVARSLAMPKHPHWTANPEEPLRLPMMRSGSP